MGVSDELERLAELFRAGGLTEHEYQRAKARILADNLNQADWPPPPLETSNSPSRREGPYSPQGLTALGRWVTGLIWIGVGLGGIALLTLLLAIAANASYEALGTEASAVAADNADDMYLTWSGVLGIWIILAGPVFIVWLYRIYKQADAVTPDSVKWRQGWTIGGWFVPFLNLYLPYRLTADVSRSVTGSVRGTVGTWWGLLIAGGVLSQATVVLLDQPDPSLGAFYTLAALEELAYITSGMAGALMVRHLTRAVADASVAGFSTVAETATPIDHREQLIAFLIQHPRSRPSDIGAALGMDQWDVTRRLQDLQDEGLALPAEGGYWTFTARD